MSGAIRSLFLLHRLGWRERVRADPWRGFSIFLVATLLLSFQALTVWSIARYDQLLKAHGLSPAAYAGPPLGYGLLLAFGGASIRYTEGVSRFWILETAPLPRWLLRIDQLFSGLLATLALGGAPVLAALILAGDPWWAGLPWLAAAFLLAKGLQPYALPGYLIQGTVGYLMGWLSAFLIRTLVTEGWGPLLYPGLEDADRKVWALLAPLSGYPLPAPLQRALALPLLPAVALALLLVLAALLVEPPESGPAATRPALAAWRWLARIPRAPLAAAAAFLIEQLDQALARTASLLGLVAGLDRYLGWQAPAHPSIWAINAVFWWPVLARRLPLPEVLTAHLDSKREAAIRSLRGKVEALALTFLPLALWLFPWKAAALLLGWLALWWWAAPVLAGLPPAFGAFVLIAVGGALAAAG